MLVEVMYGIAEKLQKRLLVETGEREGDTRTEPVDLDNKELRQAWVTLFGLKVKACITHRSYQDEIKAKYGLGTFRFEFPPAYAELLTNDEIKSVILATAIIFELALAKAKREGAEAEAQYKSKLELSKPIIKKIKEAEEAEDMDMLQAIVIPEVIKHFEAESAYCSVGTRLNDAIDNVRKAQNQVYREAKKAQRESEMSAWIEAHGSERLQRAFSGGYEIGRIYTLERAAHEYPEWDIDFKGQADWKDRKNPSLGELNAAREEEGKTGKAVVIVWLIKPLAIERDDYYDFKFEEQPALVIRGFLGKYDLVKSLL